MKRYRVIQDESLSIGSIVLTTIQPEEIEKIRIWRNRQIDVLRQKKEISNLEQIQYFQENVWPELELLNPKQVLISIYQNGIHIGYGGLVHISWEDSRAEISFLLDTAIDETGENFKNIFKSFLEGIEKIAVENLKLTKLVLETYSFRKNHITVIESNGFLREGTLADNVSVRGIWFDSILHGKIVGERSNISPEHDNLKKVLLTSSSNKVPLINSLKKSAREVSKNIKIIAGDIDSNVVSKYAADDFWQMPELTSATLEEILEKCIELNIGLVIPSRDGELRFWAQNKKSFEDQGISILVSELDAVELCLDKLEFYKFLMSNGVECAETFTELPDIVGDTKFVVKERYGSGSRKMALNLRRDEVEDFAALLEHPIVQQMIVGREISADIWIIPDFYESVVLRSRDLVRNGESLITTVYRDSDIELRMLNIAKKLGINGAAVIQAIIGENGKIHIIECNARIGGASTASIAAGSGAFISMLEYYILKNTESKLNLVPKIESLRQIRIAVDEHVYDIDF